MGHTISASDWALTGANPHAKRTKEGPHSYMSPPFCWRCSQWHLKQQPPTGGEEATKTKAAKAGVVFWQVQELHLVQVCTSPLYSNFSMFSGESKLKLKLSETLAWCWPFQSHHSKTMCDTHRKNGPRPAAHHPGKSGSAREIEGNPKPKPLDRTAWTLWITLTLQNEGTAMFQWIDITFNGSKTT